MHFMRVCEMLQLKGSLKKQSAGSERVTKSDYSNLGSIRLNVKLFRHTWQQDSCKGTLQNLSATKK